MKYIDIVAHELGPEMLDAHWLSQALHIRPDLYRPDIFGRAEKMDSFAEQVQEAFDVAGAVPLSRLRKNRCTGPHDDPSEFLSAPGVTTKLRRIYKEDFDRFGYCSQTL